MLALTLVKQSSAIPLGLIKPAMLLVEQTTPFTMFYSKLNLFKYFLDIFKPIVSNFLPISSAILFIISEVGSSNSNNALEISSVRLSLKELYFLLQKKSSAQDQS